MLTMLGSCMALLGCIFAIKGFIYEPICLLVVSGVCDAFDGKLARRKKYDKKPSVYGTQLDSLSDMISFGVFPLILTTTKLSSNAYFSYVAILFCALCGMIRLAYFNTLDIVGEADKKYFVGMPITSISITFPLVYLISAFLDFKYFDIVSLVFFIVTGLSFIYGFKIRKLTDKEKGILSILGAVLIILLFCYLFFI